VLEDVSLVLWGRGVHVLESDDIVANLYVCDALADGLDDTGTLVTEDNGERALGVLSGECVGIWRVLAVVSKSHLFLPGRHVLTGAGIPVWQTPV
jgi:hypothetical protein